MSSILLYLLIKMNEKYPDLFYYLSMMYKQILRNDNPNDIKK